MLSCWTNELLEAFLHKLGFDAVRRVPGLVLALLLVGSGSGGASSLGSSSSSASFRVIDQEANVD